MSRKSGSSCVCVLHNSKKAGILEAFFDSVIDIEFINWLTTVSMY